MPVAEPTRSHYRGLEIDAELARLIRHMPSVDATRETLQSLQGVWDSLAMLGELSGTGVEIDGIRAAFSRLTGTLVNHLGHQVRHKAARAQLAKAQVTADILVRNLFERTADIGFLATDDEVRRFVAADPATRDAQRPALRQRLREYQRKYSVYEDVVLLAPDGELLARLDEGAGVARTRDTALLDEVLRTTRPYVERYGAFDLCPQRPRSLVYASRVTDAEGRTTVGVLCLVFRFEDECERIFRTFVAPNDWSVVALLDAQGRTIASSDAFQVPIGAQVGAADDARAQVLRFAGRSWLAVSCTPQAFQGYAGPGWRGHAMTPLEHAFATDEEGAADALDPATAARLQGSRVLYPEALRGIAQAARRIESDLSRAVWNGNLALAGEPAAESHRLAFSRALLREIGRTGARTREGFTGALAETTGAVAAATLAGARARAALAIDILDRSLYERANDCRWWALTTRFRAALEGGGDTESLGETLRAIHALYTVYANLVLFDRDGRIVAAARADDAAAPGRRLDAEWIARTLALRDTQGYVVSAFEPTPLYAGAATWVYAAAVRGLVDASRAVGCIAIVFDATSQLRSMLVDTLPRDADGRPQDGAFAAFVDRDGRVVACSDDAHAVGAPLDGDGRLRAETAEGARALRRGERWYATGSARSGGYREFKGRDDPYREEVTALVFEALTDAGADARDVDEVPAPPLRGGAARAGAGRRVELATLRIGHGWHALAARDLREAMRADTLLVLPKTPPHVRGSVMFDGQPIAVLDIALLLGAAPVAASEGQIVVLQPEAAPGLRFGLLVDALGDNPVVGADQIVTLAERAWQRGPGGRALVDSVVTAERGAVAGGALLTLLSVEALVGLLRGA